MTLAAPTAAATDDVDVNEMQLEETTVSYLLAGTKALTAKCSCILIGQRCW